jgi:hypothetical protein
MQLKLTELVIISSNFSGTNVTKHFNYARNKLEGSAPSRPFQSSLIMFVGMARNPPQSRALKGATPGYATHLLANIKLDWKGALVTDTQVYYK